jgi:hypothetical protein
VGWGGGIEAVRFHIPKLLCALNDAKGVFLLSYSSLWALESEGEFLQREVETLNTKLTFLFIMN